jgi:predicted dehydrogenase
LHPGVVALTSRNLRCSAREMSHPIPVAVVGAGYFGRLHARHYAANPAAKLVAVVDIDEARARAVAHEFGAEPATDYRQLDRIAAASVAVPTGQHFEVACGLIDRGIHVLVEKPITDSVESARFLAAFAKRQRRVLQVGHIERFSGTYRMLAKEVNRPLYIESYRVSPWKQRAGEVDVVLDLMIHDIDIIQGLVGLPVTAVHAVGTPVINPTADLANARLMFGSACVATVTASRISYKSERRIRIFQPNRYMIGDFANNRVDSYTVGGDPMVEGLAAIKFDSVEIPKEDSLANEIAEFLACVVSGCKPKVDGWDGCEALRVAKMVTDSIDEHRLRAAEALAAPTIGKGGRCLAVPSREQRTPRARDSHRRHPAQRAAVRSDAPG